MPRYNAALCPLDPAFATACVDYAQRHFAVSNRGYVLAPQGSLPHVTVCQFDAPEAALADIWAALQKLSPQTVDLVFDMASVKLGRGKHKDFIWFELGAVLTPVLNGLWHGAAGALDSLKDVRRHRPNDPYRPHMTLARLGREDLVKTAPFKPEGLIAETPRAFALTLGAGDENGVYREKLFPV